MPTETTRDDSCKDFAVLIYLFNGGSTIIDLEDYDHVSKHRWRSYRGYVRRVTSGKAIWLHRVILGLGPKAEDPRETDHKNRDKMDNRRSNLRVADKSQNAANIPRVRLKGPYRGVRYLARPNAGPHVRKWAATIRENKKGIYLGMFFTAEEAAQVYDAAAVRIYGEFAVLNFPKEHSL